MGDTHGFGPDREKARKELSQKVRRAEQFVEDQDSLNARRIDRRAEQSVEKRDALNERRREHRAAEQSVDVRDAVNAARRAHEQVTISVRLALRTLYTCALGCWE